MIIYVIISITGIIKFIAISSILKLYKGTIIIGTIIIGTIIIIIIVIIVIISL